MHAATGAEVKDSPDRNELRVMALRLIQEARQQLGTSPSDISEEALDFLVSSIWQAGSGGLTLAVKRACVLSDDAVLQLEDFDIKLRQARSVGKFVEARLKSYVKKITRFEKFDLYNMVIPEVEKSLIIMVLDETNGNQIRAAKLLGINRNTLRAKIRKLGIKAKP